jgi:DNA-directed RNA polymerase specialized sigma24 family protein
VTEVRSRQQEDLLHEDFMNWYGVRSAPMYRRAFEIGLHHHANAEDLVQTVALRFWRRWSEPEFRSRAWKSESYALRSIANAWNDVARSEIAERNRARRATCAEVPEDPSPDVDAVLTIRKLVLRISESTARRYHAAILVALREADRRADEEGGRDGRL